MPGTCAHGFDPAACLICRTLASGPRPTAAAGVSERGWRPGPTQTSPPVARPDRVYAAASSDGRSRRGLGGHLVFVLVALLALGAAIWILAGVVFTVLHLLELIVVAAGAGWVGYRIGHFKGSRSRPPRD